MGRSKPPRYLGWTKEEHGWWAWPAVSSQEGSALPLSLWGRGLGRRCVRALNSGLLAWMLLAGIKQAGPCGIQLAVRPEQEDCHVHGPSPGWCIYQ